MSDLFTCGYLQYVFDFGLQTRITSIILQNHKIYSYLLQTSVLIKRNLQNPFKMLITHKITFKT